MSLSNEMREEIIQFLALKKFDTEPYDFKNEFQIFYKGKELNVYDYYDSLSNEQLYALILGAREDNND